MDGRRAIVQRSGNIRQWLNLYMWEQSNGKFFVPKPLEWVELQPEEYNTDHEPLIRFHEVELVKGNYAPQELMDSLWACGIRPTEGQGSAGAMAAQTEHLKDMREMNKKLLDKVLKE
jgi:hypothetical protein